MGLRMVFKLLEKFMKLQDIKRKFRVFPRIIPRFSAQAAFTLIELLIVISIVSVLASIMLGSQYAIREQISLFQDQYKIMDMLNQAKSLTLGAFQRDSSVCGYGVSFDAGTGEVLLYKDNKEVPPGPGVVGTDCNSDQHNHEFNPGVDDIFKGSNNKEVSLYISKTEQLRLGSLSNGAVIGGALISSVVFNAPSLTAYLNSDNDKPDNIVVTLRAIQSAQDVNININQIGQVSTQ